MILPLIFLFFILTPGILWSYPKKTNKYVIALLHAAAFVLIWNLTQYLTMHLTRYLANRKIREGLDETKEEDEEPKVEKKDEPKVEKKDEPKVEKKDEPKVEPKVEKKVEPKPNTSKFVLGTELYSDSEVIDKINTMEGPPTIVGANLMFGPDKNKSYLLFTNEKNNTSRLDNLIKFEIIDPKMKRITDFIEFHKKYPDML